MGCLHEAHSSYFSERSRDQTSPSLLEREVVRLVTPGTLTEPLDQGANYLLCIAPGPTSELGLAWADVSTAEFKVTMTLHAVELCHRLSVM